MATTPSNRNFAKFRQLVSDSTKDFKRISESIIEIEKELRADGHTNIADMIRDLQEAEEVRLQLCAKWQISKQEATDNPDVDDKLDMATSFREL